MPWNKGLTKDTHPSIAKQAETQKGVSVKSRGAWRIGQSTETHEGIARSSEKQKGQIRKKWAKEPPKDLKQYREKVYYWTAKNYEKDKDIINPDNLPRTLNGVDGGYQLDHIMSVQEGYERGIPAELIASSNNLQMLPWEENRSKSNK
jgi:hypothetical protein